ncbi:glycosyltransferase family 39 protein [Halomonas sp.]|uniref:glycosyltransferase family 39 protein n=1 Tax=Halomonas sp. TaxID=1486246 RepID=UPI003562713F
MKNISDYFTYFLVGAGILLSMVGVFYQYSYWWDELYSVVAANLSMGDMFNVYILSDVHPPLYQVILNLWVGLFGSDERVTRLLSLVFSIASLSAIWFWAKNEVGGISFKATIIFFATSSLFAFYAQETRSYSMMLMLSSFLTISYLKSWHKDSLIKFFVLIFLSISLTLTHYFGFIYAGLILIFSLYDVRKDVKRSLTIVFSGISCLIWPFFHFLKGGIGEKTGENFWIKSEGIQSTIYQLSSGMTPQLNYLSKAFPEPYKEYVVALIFVSLLAAVTLFARKGEDRDFENSEKLKNVWISCTALLVAFVIIIAAIDYHSPISTRRNYIVVLPIFSILLGLAAQGLKISGLRFVFLLIFIGGVGNLAATFIQVKSKVSPMQNHAEAIAFVEKNSRPEGNIYYLARNSSMPEIQKMMAEFYFNSGEVDMKPIYFDGILGAEEPFYIIMQHQNHDLDEVIEDFERIGLSVEYFAPQDNQSVAVIYSK